jgi:hypothetical protein
MDQFPEFTPSGRPTAIHWLKTARHCTHGGLNFIIESHGIALKSRTTIKKSFAHAVIGNSRRQSMPLLASHRSFYKTAVDPLKTPGWIGSQVCLPGRNSWPTDRSFSRKGLHQTGGPRREQQGGEKRLQF